MNTSSITEIAENFKKKKYSSVELTNYYLERIRKHSYLNAFISSNEQQAIQIAEEADKQIAGSKQQLLTGIPMAHKDIFCTKEGTTSCGSRMLEHYRSPFDATIVKNLKAQCSVHLGKTNMDEFAMGSTNKHSYFGPVLNPWNTNYVPGGSSGGSAAAVAADLCVWATATDTGGSIRQPASFCGVTGIKPTYGRISRYGMIAYASSLDQGGVIARSAEDCAIALEAISGFDPKDSTSYPESQNPLRSLFGQTIRDLKIGIPDCFFNEDTDSEILTLIKTACKTLEAEGAIIVPLELKHYELWVPCYYVIACAEASSNLSRYDGVRFGHRSANTDDLHTLITRSREEGFGLEVKRRIVTGTHVLSAGYFDAYYLQALKLRRIIRDDFNDVFTKVDVLLGPTCPTTAFSLETRPSNPVQEYMADVFTVGANLAGLPAMSLPVGFVKGLPVGMQLIGKAFDEARLLQLAHYYQQITNWHSQQPSPKE